MNEKTAMPSSSSRLTRPDPPQPGEGPWGLYAICIYRYSHPDDEQD